MTWSMNCGKVGVGLTSTIRTGRFSSKAIRCRYPLSGRDRLRQPDDLRRWLASGDFQLRSPSRATTSMVPPGAATQARMISIPEISRPRSWKRGPGTPRGLSLDLEDWTLIAGSEVSPGLTNRHANPMILVEGDLPQSVSPDRGGFVSRLSGRCP